MAGSLLPQPKQMAFDNALNPGIAYQFYTYEAGSLTPKATYQDAAQTIANTNPVVANARGEVVMYGTGQYRMILKDALGNTIWDRDNIGNPDLTSGGAKLVGYLPAGSGAVSRTVNDRLGDSVSVKDFGAKGDGVTDDLPAFVAAHAATSAGARIVVPAGSYYLSANAALPGKLLELTGATIAGPGRITTQTVQTNASATVTYKPNENKASWFYEPSLVVGGQQQGIALKLGAADPKQGTEGTHLYVDGHSNFLALKPSETFNPVEINFYNQSITGLGYTVNGTNRLIQDTANWTSAPFTSDMVGLAIYYEGQTYKISAYVNAREVNVTTWAGGAVTFAATTGTYHMVYSVYRGKVNVAGTTVTRLEGHTFQGYLTNTTSVFRINGVAYPIQRIDNENQITLTTSAGTQNNVAYVCYADIEGETTALRLNHSDIGEQLTVQTNAQDGCYYVKTNAGLGKFRPIIFQNGGNTALSIVSSGYVGVGRREPSAPLDVLGEIRGTTLSLRTNSLENYANNGDSSLSVNYKGYLGGTTYYRDFEIYNGKSGLVAKFTGSNGNVGIACSDPGEKLVVNGNAIPYVDNTFSCGNASRRWSAVWAANGTVQTSDERLKDIGGASLGLDFINDINPVSYRYKADSTKVRQGVSAQQLLATFEKHGAADTAAVLRDESDTLGVNYQELIAPLVRAVQELSARVAELEAR